MKKVKRSMNYKLLFTVLFLASIIIAFKLGAASITNNVFHDLQSIETKAGTKVSVDYATYNYGGQTFMVPNGVIDAADVSDYSLNTEDNLNKFSRSCVVEDTGKKGTGDSYTGYSTLSLVTDRTPANDNICDDGDGCTYMAIRYNAATKAIHDITTINYLYQMPQMEMAQMNGGTVPTFSYWESEGAANGINGEGTATAILNWQSGATPPVQWAEIRDDRTGTETTNYQWTINDQTSSSSIKIVVCD